MDIYKSCNDIPLKNFIKLLLTDDPVWICKTTPKNKLSKTHKSDFKPICRNIIIECTNLLAGDINGALFHYLKELSGFVNSITVVAHIISFLQNNPFSKENHRLMDLLKKYGFKLQCLEDTIKQDLTIITNTHQSVLIAYYDSLRENSAVLGANEKLREKHFAELIKNLNKVMGFNVDANSTTVIEFLASLEMYNSQFKNQFKTREI